MFSLDFKIFAIIIDIYTFIYINVYAHNLDFNILIKNTYIILFEWPRRGNRLEKKQEIKEREKAISDCYIIHMNNK